MKRMFLLTLLCLALVVFPAEASEQTLAVAGQFADTGPLANGYFEGSFTYDSAQADRNQHVTNVGVFRVTDFDITVFDAQSRVFDELSINNSVGEIVVTVPINGANRYRFMTHPENTVVNGKIDIGFNLTAAVKPKVVPETAPDEFTDGYYMFPMPFGEQAITHATITTPDESKAHQPSQPLIQFSLVGMVTMVLLRGDRWLGSV